MMKKWIAAGLCLAMVLSGAVMAFAEDSEAELDAATPKLVIAPAASSELAAFSDLKGTIYEAAALKLLEKGIISGYPDGTFRPMTAVTRAQAAKMLVIAADKTDVVGNATFSDMKGHWAEKLVKTAAACGIVNGYTNGEFRPEQSVTYYEMAKMILAAKGVTADKLTGTWPDNYWNYAKTAGLLSGITASGTAAATRADAALMIYNGFYAAQETPAEDPQTEPAEDPKNETPAASEDGSAADLANYGCVYAALNSVCSLVNEDGKSVNGAEIQVGTQSYVVPAYDSAGSAKLADIASQTPNGTLYAFRLKNGEIRDVATAAQVLAAPDTYSWVKTMVELTPAAFATYRDGFAKVKDADSAGIIFKNDTGSSASIDLGDKVIVYKLTENDDDEIVYESATFSAVKKNSLIRVYDVTKDKADEGNVIIVDDRD